VSKIVIQPPVPAKISQNSHFQLYNDNFVSPNVSSFPGKVPVFALKINKTALSVGQGGNCQENVKLLLIIWGCLLIVRMTASVTAWITLHGL
jgi:hypothetical protein